MRNVIIIGLFALGVLSCKKEEVKPYDVTAPVFVAHKTNHIKITVNSVIALDSIVIHYGDNYQYKILNRSVRDNDPYYLCNLESNLVSMIPVNDCSDGYLEIIGSSNVKAVCSGDCVIEYLDSTL